jgi:ribosomal protein L13E
MHHIKPSVLKHSGKEVQGKGFSPNEMKKACVNKNQMLKMKMPIDRKRKSAHEGNIAAIKAHCAELKSQEKPKVAQPEVKGKKK